MPKNTLIFPVVIFNRIIIDIIYKVIFSHKAYYYETQTMKKSILIYLTSLGFLLVGINSRKAIAHDCSIVPNNVTAQLEHGTLDIICNTAQTLARGQTAIGVYSNHNDNTYVDIAKLRDGSIEVTWTASYNCPNNDCEPGHHHNRRSQIFIGL